MLRPANICFSVIMPCYNSAAYVAQAVQSLQKQTYPNWELIAVNDGSKDKTLEILNEFAEKDGRIKVYSKKNGGYATAVNLGLEKVSGDYFLMMGSDDMLAEQLLSELVYRLSENKAQPDMIAFRAVQFKNGAFFQRDAISDFDSVAEMSGVTVTEFERQYPKNAKIFFVRDTAKCFKTSKLKKLHYFGKSGFDADGVFSTLFAHQCRSFLTLPFDGYIWTIRNDSVSANTNPKINIDRIKVWTKYLSFVDKNKTTELSKQEEKYLAFPFLVCSKLFHQSKKMAAFHIAALHKVLRLSIKIAQERKIHLSDYQGIFDENPIKRKLFLLFPCVWLKRHGFVEYADNQ